MTVVFPWNIYQDLISPLKTIPNSPSYSKIRQSFPVNLVEVSQPHFRLFRFVRGTQLLRKANYKSDYPQTATHHVQRIIYSR